VRAVYDAPAPHTRANSRRRSSSRTINRECARSRRSGAARDDSTSVKHIREIDLAAAIRQFRQSGQMNPAIMGRNNLQISLRVTSDRFA